MLLLCVVFALITCGVVLPCVIDIARTPRQDFDVPAKRTWLIVVMTFWVFGAVVWLVAGRRDVRSRQLWNDVARGQALGQRRTSRRHRPGRAAGAGFQFADAVLGRRAASAPARFVAPDDNPDFLVELERRIREWRDDA